MNDIERSVFLVGRVLAGFFFIVMGLNHFTNLGVIAGGLADQGIPAPEVAVVVTGLLLVVAGVLFVIGYHPLLGILAAALFFVPVTLIVHAFWAIDDPAARQMELSNFLRNIGLLGATLMFVGIRRPWPMSLDEFLARRRRVSEPVEGVEVAEPV